jgi:hypothetical protein
VQRSGRVLQSDSPRLEARDGAARRLHRFRGLAGAAMGVQDFAFELLHDERKVTVSNASGRQAALWRLGSDSLGPAHAAQASHAVAARGVTVSGDDGGRMLSRERRNTVQESWNQPCLLYRASTASMIDVCVLNKHSAQSQGSAAGRGTMTYRAKPQLAAKPQTPGRGRHPRVFAACE